jgi:hypothetical protein
VNGQSNKHLTDTKIHGDLSGCDVVADHLHAPALKKPLEKNDKDDHHQWTRKIVFAIGFMGHN